jgi:ribosomal protein L18E
MGKIIESEKLLNLLLTYSFNRLIRYEQSLEMHTKTSQNWRESFMKFAFNSNATDFGFSPFFLMSETDYKQLNKEALSQIPADSTTEVVQLFSYRQNQKYDFNRFHLNYDVWQKPFSKIGDFLFCPMMFFANNIWFYSFAQAALYQKTQKSDIQKMENHLGDLIRQKGWNVKVIDDLEANALEGDVDVIVDDKDTLLFIQLKRTYFRIDLKDAYYDSILTDNKASKQLNEVEKYLEKENSIYQSKHKPVKWIVSTSFENIGSKINNCIKVNYFEVLKSANGKTWVSIGKVLGAGTSNTIKNYEFTDLNFSQSSYYKIYKITVFYHNFFHG